MQLLQNLVTVQHLKNWGSLHKEEGALCSIGNGSIYQSVGKASGVWRVVRLETGKVPEHGILMELAGPRELKSDCPSVLEAVHGRGIEAPK